MALTRLKEDDQVSKGERSCVADRNMPILTADLDCRARNDAAMVMDFTSRLDVTTVVERVNNRLKAAGVCR
jgi:hypothetical protein